MENEQINNKKQTEKKEINCKRCGHIWTSRKEMPKTCPRCHRYDYFGKVGEYIGNTA